MKGNQNMQRNNYFNIFENPKVPENVSIELPLLRDPIDISNWAIGITSTGMPVIKDKILPIEREDDQVLSGIQYSNYIPKSNNSSLTGRKKEALDFFISKGLSLHQASGIVGNLIAESNLKSESSVKDTNGKMSGGIAMWNGDNFNKLKNEASKKGVSWKDFNFQLEFLWNDLNSNNNQMKDVLKRLFNSTNAREASDAWAYYERYAGYNYSLNTAKQAGWSKQRIQQEHDKRANFAEQLYNSYGQ